MIVADFPGLILLLATIAWLAPTPRRVPLTVSIFGRTNDSKGNPEILLLVTNSQARAGLYLKPDYVMAMIGGNGGSK